jgi:hypothetical protein
VVFIASAIPNMMILRRLAKIKATEARTSRLYYSACLTALLAWTILDLTTANLPADQSPVAGVLNKLTFLVVSITVFFFVTSSIYFTHPPLLPEGVFVASPIIMILFAFIIDPFPINYTSYGWQGDFASPILKYLWLGLIVLVMLYSYAKLFAIRSRVQDPVAKSRLTLFSASFVLALIAGVVLYLAPVFSNIPVLSSVGVNVSLLLSYSAFSPPARS